MSLWQEGVGRVARRHEAVQYEMTRIAVPAISTGIYGFPADIAAEIAAGVAGNPQMTEVLMIFSETEKFNLARQALERHVKS